MKDSPVWASLSALLRDGGPRRILVVEDETAVRRGLSSSLTALGHAVDARAGIEREELPLTGYDVAFLDNYFLSKPLPASPSPPNCADRTPECESSA